MLLEAGYRLLRPALFSLEAERAHDLVLGVLGVAPTAWARFVSHRRAPPAKLRREIAGLKLAGPIGLAGGLDRDGVAIPFWPSLGFGFVEVGTVTPEPQAGNPRPRLTRLKRERALINRMNANSGSAALAARLRSLRERGRFPDVPVGVVIGKGIDTPLADAAADYVTSAARLAGLADYMTVNVSSPTTPGLRSLQDPEALGRLLPPVVEAAAGTPVFLKLAPDLDHKEIETLVGLAVQQGAAAIVASNTTTSRETLPAGDNYESGGLSGRPLFPISRRCIEAALAAAAGRIPVIGVGGIESAAQVHGLLDAGCAAVQLYTALVYSGPGLPGRLNAALA